MKKNTVFFAAYATHFGGGGGNRTRVRKQGHRDISMLSR